MNTFVIAGNLTRDPVLKQVNTANGPISKCTFTVALKRPRASQNAEADFIPCTAWRVDAENIAKFFTKGRRILIQGHMVTTTYTDPTTGTNKTGYDWVVDSWEFCDSGKSTTTPVNPDDYLQPEDSGFEEVDTGTYVEEPEPVKPVTPAPAKVDRDRSEIDLSLPF